MKNILLHIVRLVAVFTIVISTTGFNVYIHHCNSSGQTYSSLFDSESNDKCNHETLNKKSCCEESSVCGISNEECCSDFKTFVKAEIDITYHKSDIELTKPILLLFDQINFDNITLSGDFDEKIVLLNDPPPPFYIKNDIINFLNNRKIEPSLLS